MRESKAVREWPFDNGGYLSGEQLFTIVLMKRKKELEDMLREKRPEIVTKDDLLCEYRKFLAESITGLTDAEKSMLMQIGSASKVRFGAAEAVLAFTDWEFRAGSCAGNFEYPMVIFSGGCGTELRFFEEFGKEELKRMIRASVFLLTGKEITMSEPVIDNDLLYAVRPPKEEWGIKIYGRRTDEKDRFCRDDQ